MSRGAAATDPRQPEACWDVRQTLLRWVVPVGCCGALLFAVACAPVLPPDALQDLDRVRMAPSARQAASWAPPVYEHAEQLRLEARQAFDEGQLAAAQILAEQAHAAYAQAVALARLAQAERARVEAELQVETAGRELATVDSQRQLATADIAGLEQRLAVLRDAVPIVSSKAAASSSRERARSETVVALRLQARLLCTAAGLLDTTTPGKPAPPESAAVRSLREARAELGELDSVLSSGPAAAPIDQAMRVRAACLSALTAARRSEASAPGEVGAADALLQRLSELGHGAPLRDDRGVVVTLRDAFDGEALTATALRAITELAKLAAEHPSFPVMIVLHQASSIGAGQQESWRRRGRAVAGQLARPGAAVELAGVAQPVIDRRGRYAARNERVEIVFVAPRPL